MRDKIMRVELVKNRLTQARLAYEEKRVEILAGLADNFLFEYMKEEDVIYFTKPIRLLERSVNRLCQCTKVSGLVPYLHPDDIKRVIEVLQCEDGGTVEFRCLQKEGYVWYRGTMLPVVSEEQNLVSFLGSLTNINQEKRVSLLTEQVKSVDSLTKLYNLSYMTGRVQQQLEGEYKNTVNALLIMDLLKFKSINEQFGYLFGDTILIQAANALSDIFYPNECIGRIGADQFMIFVPNLKKREDLFLLLDKVCRKLAGIYIGAVKEQISAVFGVAVYPENGENFHDLFSHADTACYVAKKKGYGNLMFYENCVLHLKEQEKEFYQEYAVKKVRAFGYNSFDKEITTFTVDIMQKMDHVENAIVVLLNHLANVLSVDNVKIYEASEDHNRLEQSYSSGLRHHIPDHQGTIYEEKGLILYESLFQNGFLTANSTNDISVLPLKCSFFERGIYATLQCAIYEDGIFRGCIAIEDTQRIRIWTEYEYSALYTIATIFSSYLFKMRDYEVMKESLLNLKDYDQLTKLPNISKFKKEAEKCLWMFGENGRYAIISTDFIHFKYVNDNCGYEVGDQILYEYARTLELMDNNLLIARESADRFLMLVQADDLEEVKNQITEMNQEFVRSQMKRLMGWKLSIVSGVCEVRSAKAVGEAMDRAAMARKHRKNIYTTSTCIYNEEMHRRIRKQLEIISAQEQALKNHEFEVYLQPKMDLQTNQLVGAEALVRWKQKDGTMMYPDDFIPIFEQNGFIVNIDFYVYETVCQLIQKWHREWNKKIPVSVNVSRVHLSDENFADDFEALVKQYQVPPYLLELELTESMVLDHAELAIATMKRLQEKGFLVSIDDFGAGYSSLNLLKDMKTDILKLDKEFFRQGDLRKQDKIIVSNIIRMAKQLDMKVLSEGVETAKQSEFLKESSCDMAQGYLYAKPMPVNEFEQFLQHNSI